MEKRREKRPMQHRFAMTSGGGLAGPTRTAARVAACLLALLAVFSGPPLPGAATPRPTMVGVADFYAPTPLGSYFGFIPERFAANDLTKSLSRAAGDRFTVIPRATMERAEAAMRWQEADVLRFERLGTLARAVGADWIVTGWIPQLTISESSRPDDKPLFGGEGVKTATVTVVVQTFSAAEGRIVAEKRNYTYASVGGTRDFLAAWGLHYALQPTVSSLVSTVTEQTP